MIRTSFFATLTAMLLASSAFAASPLKGTYVEARTCQVYTGPCFANGEVGSTGKDAIMTWNVTEGEFEGVDLTGMSVAVIVKTSETLGFKGFKNAKTIRAVLIVDETASTEQAAALTAFAKKQTSLNDEQIEESQSAGFESEFDRGTLNATVTVGEFAHLKARKARPGDCICSNESAYYPPLTKLEGFVPGVTIDGDVTARKLGTRWSIPDTRTAYLGTFRVNPEEAQVAQK
ncbi:MAG: DUF1326 domain-containing protein [Planctomycetaceae bacterium]